MAKLKFHMINVKVEDLQIGSEHIKVEGDLTLEVEYEISEFLAMTQAWPQVVGGLCSLINKI